MARTMIPVVLVLLGLLPLTAHNSSSAQAQQEGGARSASTADEWIDDSRLDASLLEGAKALIEIDRAPAIADIAKGLGQASCVLELPQPPAQTGGAAAEHGRPAAEQPMDTQALYERAMDAVAVVGTLYKCPRCGEWHVNAATGFFITADGALVTNYHVVSQLEHRALVAMTHDGRVFPVIKALAGDEKADVAIVQVQPLDQNGQRATFATLPLGDRTRVGQDVRVVHHADGRHYTLTQGIVSRRYIDEKEGGTRWITITADYARGSSGGPLLDDAGRVIGMVASTSSVYYDRDEGGHNQNLQMVWKQCVPVENIQKLLKRE
jgi:S1-C subfamily serine protease